MRRLIIVVALVLGSASLALQLAPAPAHAQGPSVYVTPGSGSQFDTFTFVGSGFAPGTELAETYMSPEGEVFTYYIEGQPGVVVAGSDGGFTIEVRPNVDFQGARAGRWVFSFCIVGGSDCWVGEIDIAA